MEIPLLILGIIWLFLLIIDLVWGLNQLLWAIFNIVWVAFIVEFLIEFTLASRKKSYLLHNWLTILALLVPALRVFRIFRAFPLLRGLRTARNIQLLRLISSINRGMRALAFSLNRRGFTFVLALTVIVIFAGGAGMYAFERENSGDFRSYGSAVWWTAMIITTMGSGEWPKTPEGKFLTLFLALYAFSVFGYVTASLTTFFVGNEETPYEKILTEVRSLKQELSEVKKSQNNRGQN